MKMDTQEIASSLREKSGPEFDREFLQTMIEHHKQGIQMAEMAREKSENSNLIDMAEEMIEDQNEEIEEMQKMENEM